VEYQGNTHNKEDDYDETVYKILLQFWSPKNHKYFPPAIKMAIKTYVPLPSPYLYSFHPSVVLRLSHSHRVGILVHM
jgi:hypothetical protein